MDLRDGPPDTSKRGYGYVAANQLFNLPAREISIDSRSTVDFGPSSVMTNQSPMCFIIHPTPNRIYMDMSGIELHVRCKIIRGDGGNITDDDLVALSNYVAMGMISSGEININGVMVESVTLWPYKGMIETLLGSNQNDMTGYLTQGLFHKEVAGQMDITTPVPASKATEVAPGTRQNVVLSSRYEYTKQSREVQLVSKLHFSFFSSQRFLINQSELEIKLRQSPDPFRLVASSDSADYRLEICGAYVRVPMLTISPSVFLAHAAAIHIRPALYFHPKVQIKPWLLKSNTSGDEWDDPFNGRVPSRLIVCMVTQRSFNGSYATSPYVFKHFNMASLTFEVDSKSVPNRPIRTDFSKGLFMDAYNTLFAGRDRSQYPLISRSEYADGYFFVVFEMEQYADKKEFIQQRQTGRTRLTISFDTDLTENVQVLLYATYPCVTAIDRARNVYPSLI